MSQPPSPRGVQVAGAGQRVARWFYCIFHSNKEPFVPSLLVHHLHVTAKTTHLQVTQGPEVEEGVGGEHGLREGYSPQTPPLGWRFSLMFKSPFRVNTVPVIQDTQQH